MPPTLDRDMLKGEPDPGADPVDRSEWVSLLLCSRISRQLLPDPLARFVALCAVLKVLPSANSARTMNRADLEVMTGLDRFTVSDALRKLVERGVFVRIDRPRPHAALYQFNPDRLREPLDSKPPRFRMPTS